MITKHVEAGALGEEAQAYATDLAARSPLSVQGTKKALQLVADEMSGVRSARPDSVAAIDELVAQAYNSRDLQEGMKAMAEKREPDFSGM